MPNTVIAALGVLASFWPFHPGQIRTHVYVLPTWGFSKSTDRFSGKTQCELFIGKRSKPEISYSDRALTFFFSGKLNTLQAEYRVDGGPIRRWRDEFPKLVELGASLRNDSMTNPTGGRVILPATELADAHTVTIRLTPKGQPQLFTIDGFSNALSAAEARGCTDSAFVR